MQNGTTFWPFTQKQRSMALRGQGPWELCDNPGDLSSRSGQGPSGVMSGLRAPGKGEGGTVWAVVLAHTQMWSLPLGSPLGGTGGGSTHSRHICTSPCPGEGCQGCCHLNSRSGLFPIKERSRQQHLQQAQPEGHVFSAAAEMRSLQEASCIICCGEPTGSKCLL